MGILHLGKFRLNHYVWNIPMGLTKVFGTRVPYPDPICFRQLLDFILFGTILKSETRCWVHISYICLCMLGYRILNRHFIFGFPQYELIPIHLDLFHPNFDFHFGAYMGLINRNDFIESSLIPFDLNSYYTTLFHMCILVKFDMEKLAAIAKHI